MCQFISWKSYKGKNYFLTDSDLETKEGKKLLKKEVKDDLCGHGALQHYYPELEFKGISFECSDFSDPKNFPKEIVRSIKQGKLSRFGIALGILNDRGMAEYEKIEQSAWAEYEKIKQPALAEYKKIKQPAFWKIAKQKKYRKDNWK